MSHDYEKVVVIDNGSGVCKAGFAGDDVPKVVFPSVVGEPKDVKDAELYMYVGSNVAPMEGALKVRYPLANGKVTNWDDMQLIWNHTFEELEVEARDHPVLLTEAPLNPHRNRERMLEMMFETYKVPALYVAMQAVMALYASGRTTGFVLDCGDGVSHVVPIYEGYAISAGVMRLDVAGRDITEHMQRLLLRRGYSFTTSAEMQYVRRIKEQLTFVRPSGSAEPKMNKELRKKYELPGGEVVIIDEERWKAPEVLFDPTEIGREMGGIHDLTYKSINKCDIDLRRDFYSNIILSGGTTMFPGLRERFEKEMEALVPPATKIKVTAPAERKFSVWMGASILADLNTFPQMMITQDEYHEIGSGIVHRKCF